MRPEYRTVAPRMITIAALAAAIAILSAKPVAEQGGSVASLESRLARQEQVINRLSRERSDLILQLTYARQYITRICERDPLRCD